MIGSSHPSIHRTKAIPALYRTDERFKIESWDGTGVDPLEFIAGLLQVDPEKLKDDGDPADQE